ncbi:Succinate dehydrogenase and fumarate reductase iron-sulfur protein [Paraburkholderia phenoliruptrix BR3459a]|uniref:Succinate dehydrogenase iron-sulfur subunit n=1 Tax=Paraburkholderia phenoliruptrix BR3459a TaxID=1229205 RepID=K0DZX6_9BURK|nr:Succinate dehydrogenase and fumarate reductase iron-sulfur protein [Paraburkholderia phenoliruptrix BR3459a]
MAKRTFEIYRYDPDRDAAPRMQTYEIEIDSHERMLLDALVKLKALDETLSFRRSCREGVCGSDAMNINGKNGLACLTNLNDLPQKIVLRPLPGLPVVRDLICDFTQFFNQYHSIRPYLINDTPPPEKERLQSPEERDELDGFTSAFCARAARRRARASGGTRTSSWARRVCCRRIASSRTAAIRPRASGSITWKIRTGCSAAIPS